MFCIVVYLYCYLTFVSSTPLTLCLYPFINTASSPVYCSQRLMITSTYLGSNSIRYAFLPVCSHAINVLPLPPNESYIFLALGLSLIAILISDIGFIVVCTVFRSLLTSHISPLKVF